MSLTFSLPVPGFKDKFIEDSVPLRVVTTAMALTGVLCALPLTEAPVWLITVSVAGSIIGSYVSYRRRYSSNFIGKIWISIAIIIAMVLFFDELILLIRQNVADARIPLTKLLMILIALHCFDLPRRRDLSVSALVGLTLMTAASTLSRDLSYIIYLVPFLTLAVMMFQLDCQSRSLSKAGLTLTQFEQNCRTGQSGQKKPRLKDTFIQSISALLLLVVFSLAGFALMPKVQFNLVKELRLGGALPFQIQGSLLGKIPELLAGDGSITHPENAFFGFAEEFDTNYRGKLGNETVLRVSSKVGTYMRGMAYDTFDGIVWRMSRPKQTKELLARPDHGFDIPMTRRSRLRYSEIIQMVYVESDSSNLVVAASTPYQIYFPSPVLQFDTYDGIRSPVGIQKDMVYTVFSSIAHYNYPRLRDEEEKPLNTRLQTKQRIASYLQLPEKLESRVGELAKKVAGEGNNFARAERLCKFLQKNFVYDLNIDPTPEGRDSVSDFIFYKKRGFCEHFATSLVIMCRTQGIPARLVTGYTSGEYNPFTGFWDIRMRDAHSWAEIFSNRYGWIPLDATPNSMIESQEVEQQSVFSYIGKFLKPHLEKLAESREAQALKVWMEQNFGSIIQLSAGLFGWLQKQLVWLLALAAGVSLGSYFLKKSGRLSGFLNKTGLAQKLKMAEPAVLSEASKEYLKVSNSLKSLGIERLPYETASELFKRSEQAPAESRINDPEFICELEKFLDLYSEIRFGGSTSELPQLKELSSSLDKMTKSMSEQ